MLATIRDDTLNVINMQHITPNLKRWDYSNIPGGGTWNDYKGSPYMVEVGHHLEKDPTPTHWTNHNPGFHGCIYNIVLSVTNVRVVFHGIMMSELEILSKSNSL